MIYICMIFQTFPDLSQSKTCSHIFSSISMTFWFNWLNIFLHVQGDNQHTFQMEWEIMIFSSPCKKKAKKILRPSHHQIHPHILLWGHDLGPSRGYLTFRMNTVSRFKNGKNVMRRPLDPSAAFSFKDLDGVFTYFHMLCNKRWNMLSLIKYNAMLFEFSIINKIWI